LQTIIKGASAQNIMMNTKKKNSCCGFIASIYLVFHYANSISFDSFNTIL